MSAAPMPAWRPIYNAGETLEQFAQRQRQAFMAFELAWRAGRVNIKLKGYYDQIVRDVGANAYAWWHEERWAETFGVSPSTIKRVLAALTAAGLIRRERRYGAASRTYLTAYDADGRGDEAAPAAVSAAPDGTQPSRITRQPGRRQPTGRPLAAAEGASRELSVSAAHATDARGDRTPRPHDARSLRTHPERAAETHPAPIPAARPTQIRDHLPRQHPFFEVTTDPMIGSSLARDSVKNRHLTFGGGGVQPTNGPIDPLRSQVLEREGVATFVLAPDLATQDVDELAAISRYLDQQHTIRDRPRLFAWLVTRGFGRQLLAGRRDDAPRSKPMRSARPRALPEARPPVCPPTPAPTPQGSLWTRVQACLEGGPTSAELSAWLGDTVLLELTAATAIIGTPNVFVRDAVAAHAAAVSTAIAAIAGHVVEVTVVVDGWT